MKIIILFLLIPIMASGQTSIVEILSNLNASHKSKLIKENHTELNYIKFYDEDVEEGQVKETADTIVQINGEDIKFKLLGIRKTTWKDNVLSTVETLKRDSSQTTTTYEYDTNGNIISNELKFSGKTSLMNEKKIYTYDEKKRLKTIRLIKENMKVDNVIFDATYEDQNSLPSKVKMNMLMEFEINKELIKNGYRFNFISKIPQDLIDMARKEMGGNPSEAEVLKELGPFGKVHKKYSDLTTLANTNLKEDIYEEDKEKSGKINLISTIIFDKNFNILSKKTFAAGKEVENVSYEYTDNGKVKSMKTGTEEKVINLFDDKGNLTKEYSPIGYTQRTFNNGKLVKELECSSYDDSVSGFNIYRY